MNCPSCNDKNAYVGFTTIECVNDGCKHFSTKLLEEKYPAVTITVGSTLQLEDIEKAMKDVEFKHEHMNFSKITYQFKFYGNYLGKPNRNVIIDDI